MYMVVYGTAHMSTCMSALCVCMLYVNGFGKQNDIFHLFSFLHCVCFCLFQFYVLYHHSFERVAVDLKQWHLYVRCSKL